MTRERLNFPQELRTFGDKVTFCEINRLQGSH